MSYEVRVWLFVVLLFPGTYGLFPAAVVHFYPGTSKTFRFFDFSPEWKSDPIFTELCVLRSCNYTVVRNFTFEVSEKASVDVFDLDDAGPYTFSISSGDRGYIFPRAVFMKPAYLCKMKPEEYLSRQLPEKYHRGRTVVVPCPIIGDPKPTVTWTKRRNDSHSSYSVEITNDGKKYITSDLGHLFITNFTDTDVGRYFCSAGNKCGSRCYEEPRCSGNVAKSDDYDLQIIDEIEDSKQELNYYFLNPKKEVTCWIRNTTCYNYGGLYSAWNMYIRNYSDVNVEVFTDIHSRAKYVGAKMYTEYSSPRFVSYNNKVCYGILKNYTFKDIMHNDVDCGAYDRIGLLAPKIAKYRVDIAEGPLITPSVRSQMYKFGNNVSITYSVGEAHTDGVKDNEIYETTCFKNGKRFANADGWHMKCIYNSRKNTIEIKIICATLTDSGYYQVRARNRFDDTISTHVLLEATSDVETGDCFPLECSVDSSDEVNLAWTVPNTNDSTLIYEIVLRNQLWWEPQHERQVKETYSRIGNLKPGTKYSAMVTSSGELVGRRTTFWTFEKRPSNTPQKLRCEPFYSSLECTWETIPIQDRNGNITEYKVFHSAMLNIFEINVTVTEHITIRSLKPFTSYVIQVTGCTVIGCGPKAQVIQETLEDQPQFPPTLRYLIPGKTNIRVGWDRPYGSFKYITYLVQARNLSGNNEFIYSRTIDAVDCVIAGNNVLPETEYNISITPNSTQGFGPSLVRNVITLSSDALCHIMCPAHVILTMLVVLYFT